MPVSTTAPVKSATNAERGAAASSPALPSWTTRPASITATRVAQQGGLGKSWVTSDARHPRLAQHRRPARAAARARVRASSADSGSSSSSADGTAGQRPRDGDPLALAARQRRRPRVGAVGQPEARQQLDARARAARRRGTSRIP